MGGLQQKRQSHRYVARIRPLVGTALGVAGSVMVAVAAVDEAPKLSRRRSSIRLA